MRVFRHGDIILPEVPSDWADLLTKSDLDSDMSKKMKPQLEFDFMRRSFEDGIQYLNGAEQFEETAEIIEAVRQVFGNALESSE
ncbi:hypothetical protein JW752_04975 [Candidatus Peregrinibacteria bacterium]|nr:hypothetical protein [Candidatus Peregrinibacteria bacterium]